MGDDSGRQDPRVAGQIVSLEGEAWREGRLGLIEAKGVHLPIVGLEHDAPEPLLSPQPAVVHAPHSRIITSRTPSSSTASVRPPGLPCPGPGRVWCSLRDVLSGTLARPGGRYGGGGAYGLSTLVGSRLLAGVKPATICW